MIQFAAIFQFFFKSFAVGRDKKMLEELSTAGNTSLLLLKRSWLYGLASLLVLVPFIGIGLANMLLLLKHFEYSTLGVTLAATLIFNILWTAVSSIWYLFDFKRAYEFTNTLLPVHRLLASLERADASFLRCFNQLQFNFLLFLGIIVFYVVHIFLVSQTFLIQYALLDVFCILIQLYLIRSIVHSIIDLEMDFTVAIPGKMYFIDQVGMYANMDTIDADKIKNIRSSYPNFLASFFEFGTLDILTEGDQQLQGHNTIQYVHKPEQTIQIIMDILSNKAVNPDFQEEVHGVYLKKILANFADLPSKDRAEAIRQYLREYELQIQEDYQNASDVSIREEIEALYAKYYKKS